MTETKRGWKSVDIQRRWIVWWLCCNAIGVISFTEDDCLCDCFQSVVPFIEPELENLRAGSHSLIRNHHVCFLRLASDFGRILERHQDITVCCAAKPAFAGEE